MGNSGASNLVNRLVVATVSKSQATQLTSRLVRDGFYVTQIDSRSSIWHEATLALLIGLGSEHLPHLLEHVRTCCSRRVRFLPAHAESPFLENPPVMIETEVGGAVIYVLEVERFEQIA
jgi:uncharacterized protein YaaQ